MDTFVKASKLKLRFTTSIGVLTTEDLWSLSLSVLNDLAVQLHKAITDSPAVSFINKAIPGVSPMIQLQFDVVKTVIDIRLEEQDKLKKARTFKEEKQKILALIAEKQNEAMGSKSVDELTEMLNKLEAEASEEPATEEKG